MMFRADPSTPLVEPHLVRLCPQRSAHPGSGQLGRQEATLGRLRAGPCLLVCELAEKGHISRYASMYSTHFDPW